GIGGAVVAVPLVAVTNTVATYLRAYSQEASTRLAPRPRGATAVTATAAEASAAGAPPPPPAGNGAEEDTAGGPGRPGGPDTPGGRAAARTAAGPCTPGWTGPQLHAPCGAEVIRRERPRRRAWRRPPGSPRRS